MKKTAAAYFAWKKQHETRSLFLMPKSDWVVVPLGTRHPFLDAHKTKFVKVVYDSQHSDPWDAYEVINDKRIIAAS